MAHSTGPTCRRAITPLPCGTKNWVTGPGRFICLPRKAPRRTSHINRGFAMSNTTWLVFAISAATLLAGCGGPPKGSTYRVYVSNEGSGDLTVIDPVKMEALATLPLGKRARGIHPSADGKI